MITFQTEITINRPVDQVFRFMAEPLNSPKWMDGVTRVEPISVSPMGVGSKVRLVGKLSMWKFDGPMEIAEYEPNRRWGILSTIPGVMRFQATWNFEPAGPGATHIAEAGEASLLGFWKLLEPLFAGEVKEGEAKELRKIKSLLENGM
jgi:uncharacterized protein YndB with AHSA1/START domain